MTKKIIKYYIVFLVIFFSWVSVASADVIINEFVSHPNSGEKEWIELFNTTGSPINLTGWKLIDSNKDTKDDLLLNKTVYSNGFIVFEHSSGWLNDAGDAIILQDNLNNTVDSIIYGTSGNVKAPSIGKSGALISGNWVTNQDPTSGTANSSSTNSSDNSFEDNIVDETIDPIPLIKEDPLVLKITTKIISPKVAVAGIPFTLSSLTTTNKSETYAVGRFVWNFGDGSKKEINNSLPFDYIYQYPGEYSLTLSYFSSIFNKIADSSSKIIIKVIPADIYISSVGDNSDPYIELENKSKYDIDLSNWIITAGSHYFVIPEGTILLQGKKIKLSPKITGFTGDDIKYIVITNPNKEIITTYPIENKKIIYKNSTVNNVASNDLNAKNNKQDNSSLKDPQVINLNDLSASAEESKVDVSNGVYPFIGLLVIVGLGITSFLFIKKKKEVGDYVEKEIRPEDMTIIE